MTKTTFFSTLILLVLLFSCGKDRDEVIVPPPAPPRDTTVHVTGLDLSPQEFVLVTSSSRQLTVAVTPENASSKKLTWTSTDSTIAKVDSTGLVTAVATGTANIVAASVDRPLVKVTATVTVLKDYDVHIVGSAKSQGSRDEAIYWNNGVPLALADQVVSTANAITFSGNDMYIGGAIATNHGWFVATYWKNLTKVLLTDPMVDSYHNVVNSIAVSNGVVYAAGYTYASYEERFMGSYWTADAGIIKQIPLYDNDNESNAFGIALSGSDVIVAGGHGKRKFYQNVTYWKNDYSNSVQLTDGPKYSQAKAVAVSGSDIYVAGYESCPDIGCVRSVKLWKNNRSEVVALTAGATEAEPTSMTVSGNAVYVAGFEKNAQGKNIAKYWKVEGSTVTPLALTDGIYNAIAYSIKVIGDDIFCAGVEINAQGNRIPKYWRVYKGMSVSVSLPYIDYFGYKDAQANAIYVRLK